MAHFSCRRPQVVAGDNLGALTGQLGCRESAKGVDARQVKPALVVFDRQEQVGALLGCELKNAGEVWSASA